jgi:hypothetical protein
MEEYEHLGARKISTQFGQIAPIHKNIENYQSFLHDKWIKIVKPIILSHKNATNIISPIDIFSKTVKF